MISFWYQLGFVAVSVWLVIKVWLSKTVQDWRKNRLRFIEAASKLPGPRGLPLIGSALVLACKSEEILTKLVEMCKPFEGPFHCWLGPKLIIGITKPQDIKVIMQSANATYKDPIYRFAEQLFGRGLLTSSGRSFYCHPMTLGPTCEVHRKVITTMLNRKTMNSFVKYFDMHGQRCVQQLEDRIDTGEFDVYSYMGHCAVDSALDTIMGTPGNTQQEGHEELGSSATRLYKLVFERMARIWLHPDWIYNCTNYKKLQDEARSVIHKFLENLIVLKKTEYLSFQTKSEVSNTPRLTLLEQLIAHNDQTNLMDDDRLKEEILTVFLAGEDSTTTISAFVLLMLGIHQEIQDKVRSELFEVLGEESVTEHNLSQLKYLHMVIKETLRLFPIGPILFRKLTGDVNLGPYVLPEGCTVAMFPFLTHRDPEHWPDPDVFDPDRFTPENSVGRHSHAYVPFSGGIRGCIGKQYAELYLKTVVAYVVRKYRIKSNATLNGLKLNSDIALRSLNGYKISISRV